ncbi:hypothetical protein V8F20_012253 [Naviculisporaceae sp. PSN 640]
MALDKAYKKVRINLKIIIVINLNFINIIKYNLIEFNRTIPSAGASSWKRKKLAVLSLGRDKEIKNLENSIARLLQVLVFHQVIPSSTQPLTSGPQRGPEEPENKPKSCVLLPFDRNSTFVGRQGVFSLINKIFQVKPGTQPKAALYGLGGIGNDLSIFWANGATVTSFEESFNRIAIQCKLISREDSATDRVLLVQDWLQALHTSPWLMVVDNVDDKNIFFHDKMRNGMTPSQCIPRCAHGSLLFTTRSSDIAVDLSTPAQPIPVDRLSEEEGVQLVKERLPNFIKDDQVHELLRELEYIPIAIAQAVAFISKRRLKSLAQYLEQYRQNDRTRTRMLTYEFTEHGRYDGSLKSVAKTWSISFEGIRKSNPRAADLLCLISFFQHQGIPRILLQPLSSGAQDDDTDPVDEFEETIGLLRAYSLVDASEDETTFSTHHLVQLATQWWLRTQSPQELTKWAYTALQYVTRVFPPFLDGPAPEYFSICASLLPHADPLLTYDFSIISSSSPSTSHPTPDSVCPRDIDLERATLLLSTGCYLFWQGFHQECGSRLEESFALRTSCFGESDPRTLESMGMLLPSLLLPYEVRSVAPGSTALADRIVPLGRRLLTLSTEVFGPDNLSTIYNLVNLGNALQFAKEHVESESLLREAVERSSRVFGATHKVTLYSMSELADVLRDSERLQEAVVLQEKVYTAKLKNLGPEHPNTLVHACILAQSLLLGSEGFPNHTRYQSLNGQFCPLEGKSAREKGLELLAQTWKLSRRIRGVDHYDTLLAAYSLIASYITDTNTRERVVDLAGIVLADVDTGPRKSRERPETSRFVERIERWIEEMNLNGDKRRS